MPGFESRLDDALGSLPDQDEFSPAVWWDIVVQFPDERNYQYWNAAKSVLEKNGIEVQKVVTVWAYVNVGPLPEDYKHEVMEVFASMPESYAGERLVGDYEGDDIVVHVIEMAH